MDNKCPFFCYRQYNKKKKKTIHKTESIKLVFFDMDGVLTDTVSSWKAIHDFFHTTNARAVDDYLQGKINDLEFIRHDIALWKEDGTFTNRAVLEKILFNIPMMMGAHECIRFLRNHEITTAVISAGLDILAEKVAKDLGIDYVFANGVCFNQEGYLTGEGVLRVELKHKNKNVEQLASMLNIPYDQCIAVGNSCFDISMFDACGLSIAFNPVDSCVSESADIVIHNNDLRQLISIFKSYIKM